MFQDISSVLSNLQLLFDHCTHFNGSHIDQVFVVKSFLQTNSVYRVMIITYFSDHDAVCVNFQHLKEFSQYSNSNIRKKIFDYVLTWEKK